MAQLDFHSVDEGNDLVADPVAKALASAPAGRLSELEVAEIDATLADTAAFCETYGWSLDDSANCVIIATKKGDEVQMVACVALATTRVDVNGVVRKRMGARKASFASMEEAVARSGMEYGGITPIGLPSDWPVLVDSLVPTRQRVVIGSGLRKSKIFLPGAALVDLAGAEVVEGLARQS
jgi:prolyl-tRNA editing enzyme YbaK/EbsC (Cys-tRNA(Pro) deacylase)